MLKEKEKNIIRYEPCFTVTKVDEDIIEINKMKKKKGKR